MIFLIKQGRIRALTAVTSSHVIIPVLNFFKRFHFTNKCSQCFMRQKWWYSNKWIFIFNKEKRCSGWCVFFTLCCSLIVGEEISFSSAGRKVFLLRYNQIEELIERTENSNPGVASRRRPYVTTTCKWAPYTDHFFHILHIRVCHRRKWTEINGWIGKYSSRSRKPAKRNPEGQDIWTHAYVCGQPTPSFLKRII